MFAFSQWLGLNMKPGKYAAGNSAEEPGEKATLPAPADTLLHPYGQGTVFETRTCSGSNENK